MRVSPKSAKSKIQIIPPQISPSGKNIDIMDMITSMELAKKRNKMKLNIKLNQNHHRKIYAFSHENINENNPYESEGQLSLA